MRVLLVENDPAAAKNLQSRLAAQSRHFEVADTGENALELLRHYEFDIVVLSLALPDTDGTHVISHIRGSGIATPILALTSGYRRQSVCAAFTAGADDVVDGSVAPIELIARVNAITRRSRGHSQFCLQIGGLILDPERREVTANETAVSLTGKEYELLHLLMLRKNHTLTKETILNQLYGGLDEPDVKIVDVFVCKIRKKLAQAGLGRVVATVWGRGYTIQDVSSKGSRPSTTPRAPGPTAEPHQLVMA